MNAKLIFKAESLPLLHSFFARCDHTLTCPNTFKPPNVPDIVSVRNNYTENKQCFPGMQSE